MRLCVHMNLSISVYDRLSVCAEPRPDFSVPDNSFESLGIVDSSANRPIFRFNLCQLPLRDSVIIGLRFLSETVATIEAVTMIQSHDRLIERNRHRQGQKMVHSNVWIGHPDDLKSAMMICLSNLYGLRLLLCLCLHDLLRLCCWPNIIPCRLAISNYTGVPLIYLSDCFIASIGSGPFGGNAY